MGFLIKYVVDINHQLSVANKSHIELLNGMHEGLLIVKKDTHSQWLFCNRSAGKLINTFLGQLDDCKDAKEKQNAH